MALGWRSNLCGTAPCGVCDLPVWRDVNRDTDYTQLFPNPHWVPGVSHPEATFAENSGSIWARKASIVLTTQAMLYYAVNCPCRITGNRLMTRCIGRTSCAVPAALPADSNPTMSSSISAIILLNRCALFAACTVLPDGSGTKPV